MEDKIETSDMRDICELNAFSMYWKGSYNMAAALLKIAGQM